jgi:hypothetical protein
MMKLRSHDYRKYQHFYCPTLERLFVWKMMTLLLISMMMTIYSMKTTVQKTAKLVETAG